MVLPCTCVAQLHSCACLDPADAFDVAWRLQAGSVAAKILELDSASCLGYYACFDVNGMRLSGSINE